MEAVRQNADVRLALNWSGEPVHSQRWSAAGLVCRERGSLGSRLHASAGCGLLGPHLLAVRLPAQQAEWPSASLLLCC